MIDLSTQLFGWLGIYGAMALAALGSMIGCARAGHAACGAMLDMESGHGRLIGIAAMPASQAIYGIVLTLALNRVVSADNAAPLAAIGLLGGLAQLVGAVKQGTAARRRSWSRSRALRRLGWPSPPPPSSRASRCSRWRLPCC
ncbi:hypothetical protein [Hankyongella ginsenosidimutans]|uniref:hypothetical protein n=1 Tax=Hankyongella ginsenosidimutans TaxID=1763828 RepID=UPI001CA34675|nr:hypothetical protein [Hankyongella ginsenosidimutans]